MSNAACLINEQLMNAFIGKYYETNKSSFTGSQVESDLGIEFDYSVNGTPVLSLTQNIQLEESIGSTTPSFSISMNPVLVNLYSYQDGKKGDLIKSSSFLMVFSGVFALSGNKINVVHLTAKVTGDEDERMMNYVVNRKVVPELEQKLSGIDFPEGFDVLGSSVNIKPLGITKNENLLWLDISINGGGGTTSISLGNQSPQLAVGLNNDAIQRILDSFGMFPMNKSYHSSDSAFGFGYSADFSAYINKPVISLNGNSAVAHVSISPHLDLTVKNWIKNFHLHPGLPQVNAGVNIHLSAEGNNAVLRLNLASLEFNFHSSWPWPFSKFEEAIMGWISSAVKGQVASAIESALSGVNPTLFTLPGSIPGTGIPASLSFASLGFVNSAAVGVVNVT